MAMQIAVLGLGRFGSQLARALSEMGHEVLAVDRSEYEVQQLADVVAKAAIADMTDPDALRDLGTGGVDVGVVATAELEASVLAIMNLQALGVPAIHAKAGSDGHATILRRLGAHGVVQPEKEGGERYAHLLGFPEAKDYLTLTREYGIGVYPVPARLQGKQLDDIDGRARTRRLLLVVRDNQVQLNPVRSQAIEAGDLLVFAGADEDLAREL